MDYELLQEEIIAELQPFIIAGLTVVRLPETNDEHKETRPTKAKFTIIYAGSEYEKTMSTDVIAQNEDIFVQILIESSFLYGILGIYSLASLLKDSLTGFKPSGCKQMQVSKHHSIGSPQILQVNGMWQYQVVFTTQSVSVQRSTQDIEVSLKKITFIDVPGGETNVVPPIES